VRCWYPPTATGGTELRCATQAGTLIDYLETDSIPPGRSLSFEDGNIAGSYCSVCGTNSYGPESRSGHWVSPNPRARTKHCGPAAVTVAALVLGIVGTVLATWALTWNAVSFLLQGARPRLMPVVGVLTPDAGHLLSPATGSMTDTLRQTIEQFDGPLVVGVQVANAGRVPFHVAGWGIRPESANHTRAQRTRRSARNFMRYSAGRTRAISNGTGQCVCGDCRPQGNGVAIPLPSHGSV
jgi:hypothetical protein